MKASIYSRKISLLIGCIFIASLVVSPCFAQQQAVQLPSSTAKVSIPELASDKDSESPSAIEETKTSQKIQERQLQNELRVAIETVEGQSGPFDQGLIEPLQGLADLLTEQGEYAEALRHYGRLLHINRINQGLYNDNQFYFIDKIIDGNLALRDWGAVDDTKEYKYFLAQRIYAEDDSVMLDQLNQYIEWKLTYIGLDGSHDKSRHLNALKELTEEAMEKVAAISQDDKVALARAYYRRAMVHYYFIVAIDSSDATGREISQRNSLNSLAVGAGAQPTSNLETFPQIRFELGKGRTLMEQSSELFSSVDEKQQRAMATLYLGDWQLLTDKRGAAFESYRQAYELLLASGVKQEQANVMFSRPTAIPVGSPTFSVEELMVQESSPIKEATVEPGELQSTGNNQSINHSIDQETAVKTSAPIRLAPYYAWTDALPSIIFPVDVANKTVNVAEENYLEVELDINLAAKKIATPSPYSNSYSFNRGGRGNVGNVSVIDANTSSDKTRWEALENIDLLVFRPRLVDGEPVATTHAYLRYIFAPDQ